MLADMPIPTPTSKVGLVLISLVMSLLTNLSPPKLCLSAVLKRRVYFR